MQKFNFTETVKANFHELAKIKADVNRKRAEKEASEAKKESA